MLNENKNIEDNNFISNVRKINPILDENIPLRKYNLNNQEIDNDQKINDDNNEIYKTPIIENNKINKIYNPEIILQKDEQEFNEEFENENEKINNNINNKEIFTDNIGEKLYQTDAMNHPTKSNNLKNSNSLFNVILKVIINSK